MISVSLAAILLWPNPFAQIIVIAAAAIIGRGLLSKPGIAAGAVKSEAGLLKNTAVRSAQLSKKTGAALLTFFVSHVAFAAPARVVVEIDAPAEQFNHDGRDRKVGKDAGEVAQVGVIGVPLTAELKATPRVVIDFSAPVSMWKSVPSWLTV